MPTYDYKCLNCNYKFEFFQPMSAKPLEECPDCGGSVKRLIGTGAGPIFKGSGFYQTDYKSNSKQKSKKTDSAADDVSKTKTEKTKESAKNKDA